MGERRGTRRTEVIVAVISLATSLVGFISAGALLVSQRSDLKKQERTIEELKNSLRSIDTLRESLRMPLEGVWTFGITYSRYNKEPASAIAGGAPYMKGKAGFLWQISSGAGYQYKGYFGAGIYQLGGNGEAIVSVFSENQILAEPSGDPGKNFTINGVYVARTAVSPAAPHPPRRDYRYFDCNTSQKVNERPSKIDCTYQSRDEKDEVISEGKVLFERE